MSPKSVSQTTGDKPHQASASAYLASGKQDPLTSPFPDLGSLRKRWQSQLGEIPEMPVATAAVAGLDLSGAGNTSKSGTLPELPPVRPMAAMVSSSLEEAEVIPPPNQSSNLAPMPARAVPPGESAGKLEDHHWEPEISYSLPSEPDRHEPLLDTRGLKPPTPQKTPGTESPFNESDLAARIRQGAAAAHTEAKSPAPESSRRVRHDETSTPFAEIPDQHENEGTFTEYTDKDLQEALLPLIEPSIDHFFFTPQHGIHHYLEPLLRSTVRRAIAEQMATASPFRDVPGWNKLAWKLRALMTSRTYEEVLFDHTRRYQVEEVFLLRPQTRSLISYASHNPARHAKSSKVESTVRKIATKSANLSAHESSTIKWDDDHQLVIRPGRHSLLAAIVHGSPNAVLEADLDYVLRQLEERLGYTPEDDRDIHLHVLQPMLECCLLIQSLAAPN